METSQTSLQPQGEVCAMCCSQLYIIQATLHCSQELLGPPDWALDQGAQGWEAATASASTLLEGLEPGPSELNFPHFSIDKFRDSGW